jgi:ornithine carbamoyltransferase
MRNLTKLLSLSPADVDEIFSRAADLKRKLQQGERPPLLSGRVVTQVFEKPSLRTRVSFEAAIMQLGGGSIFLSAQDAGLNGRESLGDVARCLCGYSDAVVLRTFSQALIEEFAARSTCPVINGLSDDSHPCQALTDLFTMQEVFGSVKGRRLVYMGDGNNVAASLAVAAAMLDVSFTICTPPGYELDAGFLAELARQIPTADVTIERDPQKAVTRADVIYTDVWASMGQEAEAEQRKRVFAPYQINEKLMEQAPSDCRFMHCLPARRGNEVTDAVLDGPQSIAFQQAENRMHLAKGLLVWLIQC